jgi:hypothetical protein
VHVAPVQHALLRPLQTPASIAMPSLDLPDCIVGPRSSCLETCVCLICPSGHVRMVAACRPFPNRLRSSYEGGLRRCQVFGSSLVLQADLSASGLISCLEFTSHAGREESTESQDDFLAQPAA